MDEDPIGQFFPGEEETVDLYTVLGIGSEAGEGEIKKAYRRLALLYHPDKQQHSTSTPSDQKNASLKFQQVGFAYSVLSDVKRRERYDKTGRTDEGGLGFGPDDGEGGWEAYFEDLFERVTRGKLDELKKEYQGSEEEISDLRSAYVESSGSLIKMMDHIPHSTHEDESRFISIIDPLVLSGELPRYKAWTKSKSDENGRKHRKVKADQEAKEAEEHAKELGVWDEFYGSGKKGKRKGQEDDTMALQALILRKNKQKKTDHFLDNLAAKYGAMEASSTRKRARPDEEEELESPKKRNGIPPPPDELRERPKRKRRAK